MTRIRTFVVSTAAILALTAGPVLAQTVPAPSPTPGSPGVGDPPAPRTPSLPVEKQVQGPVKKVDPAAKTVQVGWFLGLFRTTLEVTDDTHIAVDGMKASLMDIREGARVKAAYEAREGKNIAKSIEVMPAAAAAKKEGPGTSGGAQERLTPPVGAGVMGGPSGPPPARPGAE